MSTTDIPPRPWTRDSQPPEWRRDVLHVVAVTSMEVVLEAIREADYREAMSEGRCPSWGWHPTETAFLGSSATLSTATPLDMKRACVQHMRTHHARFEPFMLKEERVGYLRHLSWLGEWGGELEIRWSVSFYPQVLLNFQRKTSVGLSFDFLLYNVLAFGCYSAFTCQESKVQLNDAIFALHAAAISFITILQVAYYDWRNRKQRPSSAAVVTCVVIISCALLYALAVGIAQMVRGVGIGDVSGEEVAVLNWLDFLYFLSYVKVAVSILKYIPQVVLNMKRRSTSGWAMWNVILDMMGGILIILQLILDCWNTGDWGGISGYPVKFAIGFVSIFFDVIFVFQHYVLYPAHPRSRDGFSAGEGPSAPLLAGAAFRKTGLLTEEAGGWSGRQALQAQELSEMPPVLGNNAKQHLGNLCLSKEALSAFH